MNHDLVPELFNVLGALRVNLGLLVQHSDVFSRVDHLLAAPEVLDVASAFRGLLPLFDSGIVAVFFRNRVLLRVLLPDCCIAVRVLETRLRLHRVVCDV